MIGLDYSYAHPPSPSWLIQNGYGFVCRYLSLEPNQKNITKAEYDGLIAAGVLVVLNWEQGAQDFGGGSALGTQYATEAMRQAKALGAWPCPIYFSKDENTGANSTDAQYLAACGRVLGGPNFVGIYGSNGMCSWAQDTGLAKYAWANIWGNQWWPGAQLRQVGGGALAWGSVDFNQSMETDFGQTATNPTPVKPPDLTNSFGGSVVQILGTPSGRCDVILIGGDGAVWWTWGQGWQDAETHNASSLGGQARDISALYWSDYSHITLVAVGPDGSVWENTLDVAKAPSASGWTQNTAKWTAAVPTLTFPHPPSPPPS